MQKSVQELTQQIYHEGVAKAQAEAEAIKKKAEEEARALVDRARAESEAIQAAAHKQAQDVKAQVEAELKLTARQAVGSLQQKLSELISTRLSQKTVAPAFEQPQFIQELIKTLLHQWWAHYKNGENVALILPQAQEKQYQQFVEKELQDYLQKGFTLRYSSKLSNGFAVEAQEEGVSLGFTQADFEAFFKEVARPRIYQMLFEKPAAL